jgi:hypothetical protein
MPESRTDLQPTGCRLPDLVRHRLRRHDKVFATESLRLDDVYTLSGKIFFGYIFSIFNNQYFFIVSSPKADPGWKGVNNE